MRAEAVSLAAQEPRLRDWVALLKPRVMSLAIFTALVGLAAAPGSAHPVLALAAVLCIAAGAGAAGALNQWYDADIDARMRRTRGRPAPAGRIAPREAFGFGLGLAILSVAMLGVMANPLAAALLAFTIFFYVVVYTMWLKRRTPQNIVIGGAAGAFPPMIGWAAAGGGVSVEGALMFLVIFLWTPPHFWALALVAEEDYRRADVPMLPVAAGDRATRRQIFGYALALAAAALATAFTPIGGPAYLTVAIALNAIFLGLAAQVARRGAAEAAADRFAAERRLFGVSIGYLFILFAALAAEALTPGAPAGWPALF